MSQAEIQSLCEIYIGRKFDENDVAALRDFLRDLQVQKVKKAPEPKQAHHKEDERKFIPVAERKQHLVKEVAPGDRPAPVPLTEFGSASGAKERAAAYAQNVNSASSTSLSAARVENELGDHAAKVADRKAHWASLADQPPASPPKENKPVSITDESGNIVSPRTRERLVSYEKSTEGANSGGSHLAKERVAEVSGVPGVKDRLGAWNQVTAAAEVPPTSNKSVVEERLAEVKGVSGVKDRAGAFVPKENGPTPGAKNAIDEVKSVSASGVKERLGNWDKVIAGAQDAPSPTSKPVDLPNADVKSRKEGWLQRDTQDTTISSTQHPALAEARTAELKKTQSVRDRLQAWSQVATDDKPIERAPVYIPTDVSELPTKETQGQ